MDTLASRKGPGKSSREEHKGGREETRPDPTRRVGAGVSAREKQQQQEEEEGKARRRGEAETRRRERQGGEERRQRQGEETRWEERSRRRSGTGRSRVQALLLPLRKRKIWCCCSQVQKNPDLMGRKEDVGDPSGDKGLSTARMTRLGLRG